MRDTEEKQNRILNSIEAINDTEDLITIDHALKIIKKHQHFIMSSEWEEMYKERCGKYYIPLDIFLKDIIEQYDDYPYALIFQREFEHNWYPIFISDITNVVKDFEMKMPQQEQKMICTACACEGCEYIKDHLGYTCEECKNEMCFTGYEGYCEE